MKRHAYNNNQQSPHYDWSGGSLEFKSQALELDVSRCLIKNHNDDQCGKARRRKDDNREPLLNDDVEYGRIPGENYEPNDKPEGIQHKSNADDPCKNPLEVHGERVAPN
jgi:hypothetical protein